MLWVKGSGGDLGTIPLLLLTLLIDFTDRNDERDKKQEHDQHSHQLSMDRFHGQTFDGKMSMLYRMGLAKCFGG
jgi:hypothetical protein